MTDTEETVLRKKSRIASVWAGYLAVLGMITSAIYVLFPFGLTPWTGAPAVYLSSRARTVPDEVWRQNWQKIAGGLTSSGSRFLDAGPIVDNVLGRVSAQPESRWRADDPEFQKWLREQVLDALVRGSTLQPALEAQPKDRVGLATAPVGFPIWAIESVELAILKAMVEQYGADRILMLMSPRSTALGPVTQIAEAYLSNSPRIAPGRATVVAVDQDEMQPRLQRVLALERVAGGGVNLLALVKGPERPSTTSIALCVKAATDQAEFEGCSQPRQYRPAQLQTVEIAFSDSRVLQALVAEQTNMRIAVPIPQVRRRGVQVTVAGTDVERRPWETTLSLLSGATTQCGSSGNLNEQALHDWRTRNGLAGAAPDAALVTVSNAQAGPETTVIDATQPYSVFIYPSVMRDKVKALPEPQSAPSHWGASREILAIRSADVTPPNADSLEGIPLSMPSRGPFLSFLDGGATRPSGSVVSMLSRLYDDWRWDRQKRPQPIEIIQTIRLPSTGTKGDDFRDITHLGVDPAMQGMFLNGDCSVAADFDPDRFFGLWKSVIDAARRSSMPISHMAETVVGGSAVMTPPVVLLSADDLFRASTKRAIFPAAILSISMAIYGAVLIRGLRAVPKWRLGPPDGLRRR